MDIDFSNHICSHEFGIDLQSPSTFVSGGSCEVERESDQSSSMAIQDDIFFEPSWESILVQQTTNDVVGIGRKRSAAEFMQKTTPAGLIDSTVPNKRRKVSSLKRSSQKLTDRITALQKLVSPYGKTDTASVLLEASISIKALQHQIQDLFHRQSQDNLSQRGERHDLQSRGLRLVPLSFSNFTARYPIHI